MSDAKLAMETMAGALVWWEFDSVLVKPSTMLAILKKHGMENEITVPSIDATSAIRKAASSFTGGERNARVRAKVIGVYDDGSVEVAIVQDFTRKGSYSGSGTAGADQVDSVVFDTNAGQWLYAGTTDYATSFVALADQKREYLGHDFVRRFIVHRPLSNMGAFPLRRKQGGFYFVPSGTVDKAKVIEKIVGDIPAECDIMLAEINASTASKKSIGQVAHRQLRSVVGGLKDRLAKWNGAQRTPRSDAVAHTLEEFSMIADHAKLYRDALNLEIGDLDSEMQEAMKIAQDIAGVVEKGIPPMFVTTVKSLEKVHKGEEIPWSIIAKTGLPDNASNDYGIKWWVSSRGKTAANEAGFTATTTTDGVTFQPKGSPAPLPPEPEEVTPEVLVETLEEEKEQARNSREKGEVVIEEDDDEAMTRRAIASMKAADLRSALGALGFAPAKGTKVAALRGEYLSAIGLS